MRRTLVVCEDAGGARALAPVARMLTARGDEVACILGHAAVSIFDAEDALKAAEVIQVDDGDPDAILARTVSGRDVLLCASSCWGLRLEARAVLAARTCGLPALTFIDFWSNYRARLRYPDLDGCDLATECLAVVDDVMRADLIALGVPTARIVVTGSPAFERLFDHPVCSLPATGPVLFLSQPLATLYGADASAPGFLGYTEHTVLAALAPAVAAVGARLVVRPHPREDVGLLSAFVASLPCKAMVEATGTLIEAIESARVVVGMTTMALVEAALLGRVSISAQLGRVGDDPLPTNRSGFTVAVTDAAALVSAVTTTLAAPPAPDALISQLPRGWLPGATARVVAALDVVADREGVRTTLAYTDSRC